MSTVEMSFTALPAHVRTARLVATAVARRSGVAEALLDEVRLAVGEACSRAVEVHQEHCPDQPVQVALTGTGGRFEVVVTDTAAVAARDGSLAPATRAGTTAAGMAAAGEPVAAGGGQAGPAVPGEAAPSGVPDFLPQELGLAVIAGLADDVQIDRTPAGMSIRMSWPSGDRGE